MTRITTGVLARGILDDVGTASARLSATQRKLASGRELTRPSDDPTAVARAIELRTELEGAQQHRRTVDEATAWTEITDSALDSIGEALQRARELVVAGGSDAAGPVARRAAAEELRGLVDTMKQAANASYGGRHVFSGTATDTPPYAVGGSDAYLGDTGAVLRGIGAGVSVTVNVTGPQVFGTGADDLLATMRRVIGHLESGTAADGALLRGADLAALDGALDRLSATRAQVGSTANRLEAAGERLADLELSTVALLSEVEDVDVARAMVDFSTQQAALQAALKAGASIVQTSLLDFLR